MVDAQPAKLCLTARNPKYCLQTRYGSCFQVNEGILYDLEWIPGSRSPVCSSLSVMILENMITAVLSWVCCSLDKEVALTLGFLWVLRLSMASATGTTVKDLVLEMEKG